MQEQEDEILIISDDYEIHPGAAGGFALVAVRSGEAVASFSTLQEARAAALKMSRE